MYSLRLKDGSKIKGIHYKPSVGSFIKIDDIDKWYVVLEVVGRIAYARETVDPNT